MSSSFIPLDAQEIDKPASVFDSVGKYLHGYMASDQCPPADRAHVKNIAHVLKVFGESFEKSKSSSLDIAFDLFIDGMNLQRSLSTKREGNHVSSSGSSTRNKDVKKKEPHVVSYGIIEDAQRRVERGELPQPPYTIYGPNDYPPPPKYEHKPHLLDARSRPREPTPPPPEVPEFVRKYVQYPGGEGVWLPENIAKAEHEEIQNKIAEARAENKPISRMRPRYPPSESFRVVDTPHGRWFMHPQDGGAYKSALAKWASETNARREKDGILERVEGDYDAKKSALKRKSMESNEEDVRNESAKKRRLTAAASIKLAELLSRPSKEKRRSRLSTNPVIVPEPSPLPMSSNNTPSEDADSAHTEAPQLRRSPHFSDNTEAAKVPTATKRALQRSLTLYGPSDF